MVSLWWSLILFGGVLITSEWFMNVENDAKYYFMSMAAGVWLMAVLAAVPAFFKYRPHADSRPVPPVIRVPVALLLADSYAETGKIESAIAAYRKASLMIPCRFEPLDGLLEVHDGDHPRCFMVVDGMRRKIFIFILRNLVIIYNFVDAV